MSFGSQEWAVSCPILVTLRRAEWTWQSWVLPKEKVCMTFSAGFTTVLPLISLAQSFPILKAAWDRGINTIDTVTSSQFARNSLLTDHP